MTSCSLSVPLPLLIGACTRLHILFTAGSLNNLLCPRFTVIPFSEGNIDHVRYHVDD